jgi:hypothetical protein
MSWANSSGLTGSGTAPCSIVPAKASAKPGPSGSMMSTRSPGRLPSSASAAATAAVCSADLELLIELVTRVAGGFSARMTGMSPLGSGAGSVAGCQVPVNWAEGRRYFRCICTCKHVSIRMRRQTRTAPSQRPPPQAVCTRTTWVVGRQINGPRTLEPG